MEFHNFNTIYILMSPKMIHQAWVSSEFATEYNQLCLTSPCEYIRFVPETNSQLLLSPTCLSASFSPSVDGIPPSYWVGQKVCSGFSIPSCRETRMNFLHNPCVRCKVPNSSLSVTPHIYFISKSCWFYF